MTVTEAEWAARAGERSAAANGDEAAWTVLFTWLWPWTVQLAGSADGAMAGWLKVVRNPPALADAIEVLRHDLQERGSRRRPYTAPASTADRCVARIRRG